MQVLPESFYLGEVTDIARQLLGKRLVRVLDGRRIAGIICETEAYRGEEDMACHARSGKTTRNAIMYESGGRAYVYFTYGMHWLFNVVCGPKDFPSAVLVRSLHPVEGLDLIAARRSGVREADWCNGPARLTKALAIDRDLYGAKLFDPESLLVIEDAQEIADTNVKITPRVGIQYAPEPWLSMPWRFVADGKVC